MPDRAPRVFRKRDELMATLDPVYIGRPSKWGNPFIIGKDGTREEVVGKYQVWLHDQPELISAVRSELRGRDLICWCAPELCHGDVLLLEANR